MCIGFSLLVNRLVIGELEIINIGIFEFQYQRFGEVVGHAFAENGAVKPITEISQIGKRFQGETAI
jgi:hypothetical protein